LARLSGRRVQGVGAADQAAESSGGSDERLEPFAACSDPLFPLADAVEDVEGEAQVAPDGDVVCMSGFHIDVVVFMVKR